MLKKIFSALLLISAISLYCRENPILPENFVARPTFIHGDFQFDAGTAFFLGSDKENTGYIVTAHHLFGPMGGLPEDIPPNGLHKVASSIRMTGIKNGMARTFAVRPLIIRDDPELTSENPFYDKHVDLAIFRIEGEKDIPWGTLALDTLRVGDIVRQAGEPRFGQEPGELLHSCRIIKRTKAHA